MVSFWHKDSLLVEFESLPTIPRGGDYFYLSVVSEGRGFQKSRYRVIHTDFTAMVINGNADCNIEIHLEEAPAR